MRFTIIDVDVFETMLAEINNLTNVVTILHQNYGDRRLRERLNKEGVRNILNISTCTL